jgi:peptide/nickel transport system substrate-binding protein
VLNAAAAASVRYISEERTPVTNDAHRRPRRLVLAALAVALAVVAASCGGSDDSSGAAATTSAGARGGTLVFGATADPIALDGALVSDGESLRAVAQMFETLVSLKPGTTEVVPGLAERWEASNGGKTWAFTLRDGVTFHDGTALDAEAVCFNFDRWYGFTGSFQNPSASYYWQTVFGGFRKTEPDSGAPTTSLYAGCTARDAVTPVIELTHPSASFLGALSLPSFSIGSPKALEEYGADRGTVDEDGVFHPTGTYATEHPVGTGPFRFESWTRDDRLVLVRNEDYWAEPARVDRLVIRPISDNASRLQALQTGEIQGFDFVEPQDLATIDDDDDLQLLDRPAFNVGYVGFNVSVPPLDDVKVRQAIAHALDREEVVTSFYAGRGVVAKEFMPPEVVGYADDVTEYPYDPARAKQLLRESGLPSPVKLDFWYPSDVSRPYMPDPKRNFQAFAEDLEAVGFDVVPHTAPWSPDYVGRVTGGNAGGVYLFGWTGDFGDADNFVGTFFQAKSAQWGFENPTLFRTLDDAEVETDPGRRTTLYEEANRMIMDFLPGVPYVHTKPALAFRADVKGYVPSPVSLESFATVTLGRSG